jgi:hypothetical protein
MAFVIFVSGNDFIGRLPPAGFFTLAPAKWLAGIFQWHCTIKHPLIIAVVTDFIHIPVIRTGGVHPLRGFFHRNLLP